MASLLTSDIRFLHRATEVELAVPIEWEPAWVALSAVGDLWTSLRVTLNGMPLPVQQRKDLRGTIQVACEWPRSNPGHHLLRVEGASGIYERRVRIEPRKITQDAFVELLADLHERLPAEVALSLQRAGALVGVELKPPDATTLEGELARIRRAVLGTEGRLGLVAVLEEIGRDPHRTLRDEAPWARAFEARSPSLGAIARALVRPNNLDVQQRPLTVVDRRAVEHHDIYENRLVRSFVDMVRSRTGRLYAALSDAKKLEPASEASALLRALDRARRGAVFLDGVAKLPVPPTRLTMVLQRRAPYRAALEGLLAFVRASSARLDAPALDSPLDNLPALYQLWGSLQTHLAVLEVAAGSGFTVESQRLVHTAPGGVFVRVLPDGKPTVVLRHPSGLRARLIPEKAYRNAGALRSVSFEQRPDIALEVEGPEGVAVWLFDPKYKLKSEEDAPGDGGPKKTDIDKMHAYRDAIRDAEGRRVVRFAATLYPGPTCHYGADVAALRAWPGAGEALRAELRPRLEEALHGQAVGMLSRREA